jgi:exopolysaccharide/PEP-CTERM locus tyrosine autokinase
MSLVERALKKLQESRAGASSPEAAPAPLPSAREPAAPETEIRRPTKIVRLDREALRAAELLPAPNEERRFANEYRQIKRPLIANAFGRGAPLQPKGRVMLVASALPGDGKTFTALNLALSMALEKDVNVLLADADVAKPHLSRVLGVSGDAGLLDVLHDEKLDIESVVLRTDVEGLEILPAGHASETATELLASSRMATIVEQLTARNPDQVVLFDSPPLLLTSESRVLCAVAGQAILIVSASSTPQQAVFDAIAHIGEGRYIGLVLNQCAQPSHENYYHHYYGQREDSGQSAT